MAGAGDALIKQVEADQREAQLRVLREIAALFASLRVRYWLRGGWAIDFHLGRVTRPHADIDLVVWLRHRRRIVRALTVAGFALVHDLDVQTDLRRHDQAISIIYLAHAADGRVITHGIPVWTWPAASRPDRRVSLGGVAVRAVEPEQLLWEKESYERGTGRPPRPKDIDSMHVLRGIIAARSSRARQPRGGR
jgi:hypothetical protein